MTPEHRAASACAYVPFDVPAGTRGVSVRLAYDRRAGGLDLGLFDPSGFRGYSGGARSEFVVNPAAATPGYLAGPLVPGEWRVLLGLHDVPSAGLGYRVEVELGAADPPKEAGVRMPLPQPLPPGSSRSLPASRARRWLAGDLHAHTVHSDGALSVSQLARLAAARGLDFLAVTDHNTTSHHPHLSEAGRRARVELLPGQEVTTDEGHANCFGDVGWVDFREPPSAWREHAEMRGGLLSVNHPLRQDYGWHLPLPGGAPLAEVWHWTWDRRSRAPLEWWQGWGGVGIGGSDWHRPGGPQVLGAPTTWVEAGEDGVLAALAEGRVAISASPDGPVLLPHEEGLLADRAAGLHLVAGDGATRPVTSDRQRLARGPGPHLLLDDGGLVHAIAR